MDSLRYHRDYLEGEWQSLCAAPLSARKARLVAALIDAYVDRLFAASPGAEDILDFRAAMAAGSPALGRIVALCGQMGVHLGAEAVAVPIAEYGALSVEDFMVSLYNDHTVQRLVLVMADGSRHDMIDTVRQAIGALD
ncbi:MAG TPA: hypothetical protein VL017_09110 [Devosia sp.]|nr:hypothetical protein [Devosia sp.]